MSRTKARTKKLELAFLLTQAEKNTVLYFKKQLFTKEITINFDRWQRYMKDYDGENNGVYLALEGGSSEYSTNFEMSENSIGDGI